MIIQKRTLISILILIALLVLSGCGQAKNNMENAQSAAKQSESTQIEPQPNETAKPTTKAETSDDEMAAAQFQKTCIACHGDQLQGGFGPNLQQVGSRKSADEIKEQITNGGGGMPAFKDRLDETTIDLLVKWLAAKK